MKIFKKVLALIFTLSFIIIIGKIVSSRNNTNTFKDESKYSSFVNRIIDLDLKQFYFDDIVEANNSTKYNIIFVIPNSNYNNYNLNECIEDIILVRKEITDLFSDKSMVNIRDKMICVSFQTLPGSSINMYNYSEGALKSNSFKFLFFDNLYLPTKYWGFFDDANKIGVCIDDNAELERIDIFADLKQLYVLGTDLDKNKILEITEEIPNCTVYYNGGIYNNKNTQNT